MKNVERAISLKKELDGLRPIKKEYELKIMQKFRLDWNYHSNHLEGNSLSYGETKALILFGITAHGKPLKDHFEITGHNEAIEWIIEVVEQKRPITENFIRELHKLILKEPYEVDAITPEGNPTKKRVNVGAYKTMANHVKTNTGEIFRFATPEETPALMHDLVEWYKTKMQDERTSPILLASEFHYKFIRIHPFDDGNGRTARILMNFILMQLGYPPVIIRTEDKEIYFSVLRQADAGILEPFVEYIAENLIRSLEIMIKGAQGEDIEDPDDLDKEIVLLEQKLKGIGRKMNSPKNEELLFEIYDNSIMKLIEKFIDQCEKLTRFYEYTRFELMVKDTDRKSVLTMSSLDRGRILLNPNLNTISVTYYYRTLKEIEPNIFSFNSVVNFSFGNTNYSVSNLSGTVLIEKDYTEQLTVKEIDQLVKTEIKKHKEYIEAKIEELRNKNR